MDWDRLRIFHAAAAAGSFTHAGEQLGLSQSAVSRQIRALEDSVKAPLFHRHARGLILTEQGELLYRTAHDVLAKLAMAEAMLADSRERPSGELRIAAPITFGSVWIAPRLAEFADMYPEVTLRLLLEDRELDLGMREADVGIRVRTPTQADLVQRRLMTLHSHLYAAPEYLRRRGSPQSLDQLVGHRLITYGEDAPAYLTNVNWMMGLPPLRSAGVRPVLQVSNVFAIMQAVENGLGIASLPDYAVQGNSRVVRILPEIQGPENEAFFVYPEELRNSKRIAVFRDFIVRKVAEWRF
jgi:DNA-binding transcriptional LysR family regulator